MFDLFEEMWRELNPIQKAAFWVAWFVSIVIDTFVDMVFLIRFEFTGFNTKHVGGVYRLERLEDATDEMLTQYLSLVCKLQSKVYGFVGWITKNNPIWTNTKMSLNDQIDVWHYWIKKFSCERFNVEFEDL